LAGKTGRIKELLLIIATSSGYQVGDRNQLLWDLTVMSLVTTFGGEVNPNQKQGVCGLKKKSQKILN